MALTLAVAAGPSAAALLPLAKLGRLGCAAATGPHSGCRPAPDTEILSGPAVAVELGSGISFSFASDRAHSQFQCRLDGARWRRCRSPLRLPPVGLGGHSFRVRALAGRLTIDPSPAARAFAVVAVPAPAAAHASSPNGDPAAAPAGEWPPRQDEEVDSGDDEEEPPTPGEEEPPTPGEEEEPPTPGEEEGAPQPEEEVPAVPVGEEAPASRLFAPDSIWTTPLGADTPIDPGSPQMISDLLGQVEAEREAGGGPSLGLWSRASLYEVNAAQPLVPVYLDTGPWGDGLAARLQSGVPIPEGARPASGQDRSMAIWQPQTDSYWEFFHMEQTLHAPQFSRLPSIGDGCPLSAGTYSYKLTSLNARGETTAGTPPQQVRVPGGGCVRIFWNPVSGAGRYRIYKARGDSPLTLLNAVGGDQTSFRDDGTLHSQGTSPPATNTAATPGEWHATYGGFLAEASKSPGYYEDVRDAAGDLVQQWGWGAAATGMPLAGGMVTREDVQRGAIDHALSLGLINLRSDSLLRAGAFAFPAQRSDGRSTDPGSIPEGARLFLDPGLDLDSLELSPLARMLAEAAQRYGMIVHDGSQGTTIYAEDPGPGIARGEGNSFKPLTGSSSVRSMQGFPWSSLRVARMRLCTRGPCTAS
jgi:hypothetical protein